ncbi:PP2C family serine/threonine-protein phosphatase [Falsihalocynthiibacter arcticus]|uniref:PP2C family protein-serine/threonine phosphatase n=1 Tax=Falsihalocynthiibacter arcticus TaxID=1579316 RepID=UPI0030036FE0
MNMEFFSISDAGPRPNNEDAAKAWKLDDGSIALAIADGLGGRGAGGAASKIALRYLSEHVHEFPESSERLVEVFIEIHNEIVAQQKTSHDQRFMATTLTAVFLNGKKLIGAHAGDTRAMLARGRGIKKLTSDHSEAQRLLDEGKIDKEQFLNYPRKNILDSALGAKDQPRVDALDFDLFEGDRVFVTSDGFHAKLPLRPMLDVSKKFSDPKLFVDEACNLVRKNEPDDNFSIAVAYV